MIEELSPTAVRTARDLRGAAIYLETRAHLHNAVPTTAQIGFTPAEVIEIAKTLRKNADTIVELSAALDRAMALVQRQDRVVEALSRPVGKMFHEKQFTQGSAWKRFFRAKGFR